MAGRRQHHIPQFLLRGFADASGTVQVIKSDGSSFAARTRNVGLEKDFYGKPGNGSTDAVITVEEPRVAAILAQLLETKPGIVSSDVAAQLVAHMSLRTAAWRAQTQGGICEAVNQFGQRIQLPEGAHPLVKQIIETAIGDALRISRERVADEQLQLLRQHPTPPEAARNFASMHYAVTEFGDQLVLPDAVVYAISERGTGVPLMGRGEETKAILLPLSAARCLIGFHQFPFATTADEINGYSFDASSSIVIAHPEWSANSSYMQRFGSGTRQFVNQVGARFKAPR
ncbi:DUF4238 domain-containing protein [Ottowia sp.]|uniref:DUF4238 domain-containing protein n=1 Tax=Ottowia sp. TaxID=1898956 RepID=UPI002624AD60|nr:DUF4238 domain-containing protein [Ottowia sp.]